MLWGNFCSTLDAEKILYQICLDIESSKLLTFNTPFGRYRYLRMLMRIVSAPEVYQRRMEQVFEGVSGVEVIIDDILVYWKTEDEHDENLRAALQRNASSNRKK